jgi:hypothetical protein
MDQRQVARERGLELPVLVPVQAWLAQQKDLPQAALVRGPALAPVPG